MKVSILTYHWEDNYGAVLQAYATQRAVATLGHEPEFIDLHLPYAPSIMQRLIFGLKHHRFNKFRKKHYKSLTPRSYYSMAELRSNPPESDCYLTGSDQTWNPQIAKELLPAFFLTFGAEATRRTTYATSIGLRHWEPSSHISDEEIRDALEKFSSILLREENAIEIAESRWGAKAQQVVDPVLLFAEYPELTGPLKDSGEIVAYKLINNPEFYALARDTAKELKAPIRSIGSVRHPEGFKASYPEGVEKWVRRLAEAKAVLTDSFHGTVFSLLYHRPFVIYVGDPARVVRIESLLSDLGLQERILSAGATSDDFIRLLNKPIDWEKVDTRLGQRRQESFRLLAKALGN